MSEKPTLITSVPPLLQTKKVSCGPATVAAVPAYWGKDYSILLSNSPPYLAEDFSAQQLAELVEQLGLKPFVYSSSLDDLKNHLQNGRPVILLIPRPIYDRSPQLRLNGFSVQDIRKIVGSKDSHWVIAIGFTDSKIIIQDPANGRMIISRSKFEDWWSARKKTCLLIAP